MKTLLTLLSLWSLVCHAQVGTGDALKTPPFKEFYRTITKQLEKIDHLHQPDSYDSLESENKKIESILSSYKPQLFSFPDSLDYGLIYLTRSADKNLVLVSWDTRMGGTMIAFTTMAIFKTLQGVKTKMLLDSTDESMPYTYMHYNSIHTVISSGGKKIYLAWGNGQGSTAVPWQELRAFSVENGELIEPKVLPGKTSKIFVEFDLHEFKDEQRVPIIKIENGGKTIRVPIEEENQGFVGKYRTYVFTGKVFKTN